MPHTIQDVTKKPVVFIFQLEITIFTTARILTMLLERNIEIEEFHFHAMNKSQGRLMIHCQLEKDRIGRTATLLDKLPGVIKLDWMEGKRRL
jgi:hypothetical protein